MRKSMLILSVAGAALLAAGCTQLKARNELNKGVQAFKTAQYPDAVENFKKAVELRSEFPDGASLPGHCVHAAIYSRRGFAGE